MLVPQIPWSPTDALMSLAIPPTAGTPQRLSNMAHPTLTSSRNGWQQTDQEENKVLEAGGALGWPCSKSISYQTSE
jgi:hypothetical protein